ncbi:hypothetical protein KVT40_003511 [Elsinoe batatas]|uniref:Uncharacterized protein n=1 Tax=Elsinoe batatas TaxID=2601811 RepID=A0A8K0L8E3_9PEZI|nr:hypothetical protein KVT40_003511 [Elsinoe batatas]
MDLTTWSMMLYGSIRTGRIWVWQSCKPWTTAKQLHDLQLHLDILSIILVIRSEATQNTRNSAYRADIQPSLQKTELRIFHLTLRLKRLVQEDGLCGCVCRLISVAGVHREVEDLYATMMHPFLSLKNVPESMVALLNDARILVASLHKQLNDESNFQALSPLLTFLDGLSASPRAIKGFKEVTLDSSDHTTKGRPGERTATVDTSVKAEAEFSSQEKNLLMLMLTDVNVDWSALERSGFDKSSIRKLLRKLQRDRSSPVMSRGSTSKTLQSTKSTEAISLHSADAICSLETSFSEVVNPTTITALLEPIIASFKSLDKSIDAEEIRRISPANIDIVRHVDSNLLTARFPSGVSDWSRREHQALTN